MTNYGVSHAYADSVVVQLVGLNHLHSQATYYDPSLEP